MGEVDLVGRLLLAVCVVASVALAASVAWADEHIVLNVPYRSQFDGSFYEGANCGPATIGMILEGFATPVPTAELRKLANVLQGSDAYDGVWIYNLAAMPVQYGMKTEGLFDGDQYHKWTADDVRSHIRQGHVVVPEVRFRFLPGHEWSDTWDDHYIAIFGLVGDSFVYHDSASRDGSGSYRTMSESQLVTAMRRSEFPYAAFAVVGPPPPPPPPSPPPTPAPALSAPGHGDTLAVDAPLVAAPAPAEEHASHAEGARVEPIVVVSTQPESGTFYPALVLAGLFSLFTLGAAVSRRW